MLNHYLTLTDCRLLASLFSRSNFLRILKHDDLSHLNTLMRETGCGRSHCRTVNDYLNWSYKQLVRTYPCEYVYKNEFLNRVVLKNRLLRKSAIFNEFRASDSIADFAVFGDSSCAYEIKTRFDSPKRLLKQIDCYAKLFDSVSLIVPIDKLEIYKKLVPEQIGLVVMLNDYCGITFEELREPENYGRFDISEMMKVLHTKEYKSIASKFFGKLPSCDVFSMYAECFLKLTEVPILELRRAFLECMISRFQAQQTLSKLQASPRVLRQLVLSMRLSASEIAKIKEHLVLPLRVNL